MPKLARKSLVLALVFGWALALVGTHFAVAKSPGFGHDEKLPLYLDPAAHLEERVEDLLARMTLEEKIGQMTQAERGAINPEEVREYLVGSVFSGGGSAPEPNTPESWADLIDGLQAAALKTRLGIPILYGSDAVHGHNNLYGATIFPHNIGLGAARDPELMQRIGEITALETAATGVNWTFAPTTAVVRDIRWGRTYESFGENPELQVLVAPLIKGLQGPENEMGSQYVVATAKHYLADGAALWGTGGGTYAIDQGDVWLSEDKLREIHLPGYLEALEAGVETIMVSFTSYQGVKMHAHRPLITELLKNELGFQGLVVSDWEGIRHLPARDFYSKVVLAANAGIDLFMEPNGWKELIKSLTQAVNVGDVSMERIDDAVRRILRVKFRAGLFENPYTDRKYQKLIGSVDHREVAREAVRKSLVLLKNDGQLLPLNKNARVYVTGSNSDDLGNQCGGWTITWQGSSGLVTLGTTIREGIKQTIAGQGELVYDLEQADVVIAVLGEGPYAEGVGDNGQLSLSRADVETLRSVKEAGKPVVVVLVSGRPLIITDYIDNWDALVAAWLPGTEGQGVADVLFGDYKFTGRLPVSWPKEVDHLPLNLEDETYDPLFEYGFGLEAPR